MKLKGKEESGGACLLAGTSSRDYVPLSGPGFVLSAPSEPPAVRAWYGGKAPQRRVFLWFPHGMDIKKHWWVAFEICSPEGNRVFISPSTWVDAADEQEAEALARRKLRDQVHPGLQVTMCVSFAEEAYQKEMARLREYRKSQGVNYSRMN